MQNLKISRKIAVFLGILVLFNALVAGKLISSMSTVNDQSTIIAQNWLPSVQKSSALNTNTSDFRIAQLQHVGTTDEAVMRDAEADMQSVEAVLKKNQDAYEKLISSDEERVLYNEFASKWQHYMETHGEFLKLSRVNQNVEASAMLLGGMKKDFDSASEALLKIIDLNAQGASDASSEGDKIYAHEVKLASVQ
jgi:methyl-accepting chemotaxis protein